MHAILLCTSLAVFLQPSVGLSVGGVLILVGRRTLSVGRLQTCRGSRAQQASFGQILALHPSGLGSSCASRPCSTYRAHSRRQSSVVIGLPAIAPLLQSGASAVPFSLRARGNVFAVGLALAEICARLLRCAGRSCQVERASVFCRESGSRCSLPKAHDICKGGLVPNWALPAPSKKLHEFWLGHCLAYVAGTAFSQRAVAFRSSATGSRSCGMAPALVIEFLASTVVQRSR